MSDNQNNTPTSTCEGCGNSLITDNGCGSCGWPEIKVEFANKMACLEDSKDVDLAIAVAKRISREYPQHYLPHLKLGLLFARKVYIGEKGLQILVEKEINEALNLLPSTQVSHDSFIDVISSKNINSAVRNAVLANGQNKITSDDLLRLKYKTVENAENIKKLLKTKVYIRISAFIVVLVLGVITAGWLLDVVLYGKTKYWINALPVNIYESYNPGLNLLTNGDGSSGLNGWIKSGEARINGISGIFHVEGSYSGPAAISQEVALPKQRPAIALIVAKARSSTEPSDGMTGLPNVWGYTRNAGGAIIEYLSGQKLLLNEPKEKWGVCWGSFLIDKGAVAINISLQQAIKQGGVLLGSYAEYDDVGVYLFNSKEIAEKYAASYNGEPPSAELLMEDADYELKRIAAIEQVNMPSNNSYNSSAQHINRPEQHVAPRSIRNVPPHP